MKKIIINIAISLAITGIGILTYHTLIRENVKIAYIKTGTLLNSYKGMSEANEQFNKELQALQANIDTLKRRYELIKEKMETTTSSEEKSDLSYQLGVAEYEYNNYRTTAQQQLEARKQTIQTDVINKINSFIQDYGKENNYTIIFGATEQGSILYGQEQEDLTDLILKKLNKNYSNEESKIENE